jgi:hypothetical protein
MTINYTGIQAELDKQLKAITNIPEVSVEGSRKANGNTPWCRSTLLPVEPTYTSVGVDGLSELRGLYQVDLFYPEGYDYTVYSTIADNVLNSFTKGMQLGTNPKVLIWNSYKYTTRNTSNKFNQIPIIIKWSSWC